MSSVVSFQFLNLNFFFLINRLFYDNLILSLLVILQYFPFLIFLFQVKIYIKCYWSSSHDSQIYIILVLSNKFTKFHTLLLVQTLLNFNFISLSNLHIALLKSKIGCNSILIYKVLIFLKILVFYQLLIFVNLLIL